MKYNFLNTSISNLYTKPSSKAEVSSQIIYGEKFRILSKQKSWLKIKTSYDNYVGFIKNNNFKKKFKPVKKVCKLKAKIYKKVKKNFLPTNHFLYFASGITVISKNKAFVQFEDNKWLRNKDLREITHFEKNYKKILRLFLNSKYKWGGKTADGIDCSALIQIYYYYNRIFFPRDSKDQAKYCKKKISKNLSEGDIIFWKGHVGMCLNKHQFIHAYGPRKKVVIMPTKFTIMLIDKTAKLNIIKISNIKKY